MPMEFLLLLPVAVVLFLFVTVHKLLKLIWIYGPSMKCKITAADSA